MPTKIMMIPRKIRLRDQRKVHILIIIFSEWSNPKELKRIEKHLLHNRPSVRGPFHLSVL